nr:hypothetical protein [Tanacetum cinerariifolium]
MVKTRTDADLSAAVQNALQTLLPQIRAEIREEFRTSSGPSDAGGNPPRLLFILGLNTLISKSPIPLRRRQLSLSVMLSRISFHVLIRQLESGARGVIIRRLLSLGNEARSVISNRRL